MYKKNYHLLIFCTQSFANVFNKNLLNLFLTLTQILVSYIYIIVVHVQCTYCILYFLHLTARPKDVFFSKNSLSNFYLDDFEYVNFHFY